MQVGNILIKIVMRSLQKSTKDFQFMVLAGFNSKMSHTTADFYDTLSSNHVLTRAEVDAAIAKLVKLSGAAGYTDVTNGGVQKKLAKVLDEGGGAPDDVTFSGLGIGHYLPA